MSADVEGLGETIAELAAHLDAATHRLLTVLREFDERGGWYAQGAVSCAHWLSWRVGWDLVTARERVRVARKLGEFRAIDDALRRGELSYSKVRALMRIATPANEAMILEQARLTTASQLETLTRKYAMVQRHGQERRPQDDVLRRYVRRQDTDDGMVKIIAVLHPEEAELVWAMLDHAAKRASREPVAAAEPRRAAGRADAPVDQAEDAVAFPVMRIVSSAESSGCAEPSRSVGEVDRGALADSAESSGSVEPSRSVADAASVLARAERAEGEPSVLDRLIDEIEAAELERAAQKEAAAARAERTTVERLGAVPAGADAVGTGEVSRVRRGYGDATQGESTPPGRDIAQMAQRSAAPSPLRQRVDAERRAFDRADALLAVAQAYLRGERSQRAPIDVTITIPASSLREGADDTADVACMGSTCISAEAARRLSCDAGVVEVIEDDQGVPLSVGRKRRTIAGSIKRALLRRDTSCAYPGCANRTFLEGHHIKHWADGGETTLDNGLLLCNHHHRFVHEYGYRVELDTDRRPQFRDPQGRVIAAVPVRHVSADLGWPRIRAMNEALRIDAGTIACEWDGSRADYGGLVDNLVAVDYAVQGPAMPVR